MKIWASTGASNPIEGEFEPEGKSKGPLVKLRQVALIRGDEAGH